MHTLLRVVTLGCAGLLLSACAATKDRLPEARYTLAPQQVLPLAERLTITYEGAEDSRCPDNARCIWPGRLAYRFTMRIGSVAQAFYLVQGQPGYMSPALRGSRIELDHLTPPPPRGMAGSPPPSYPVTFNMYAQ
ncbi:hypothetical protein LK542_00440 [Massilia sp. IC2-477]|uniref:hypothetical protein n=1 Tax=Massilia sp. IC2-477 TaxID=2887198 RepID=UPI001D11DEDD|nr:hypothetical protein [Massilia sp. IC2-477]MCC2954078.1 hypothetical protein [Massilia sp. IC2-477]